MAKLVIAETEIQGLMTKRAELEELEIRCRNLKTEIEIAEAGFIEKLAQGATVRGKLQLLVEQVRQQGRPKWKEIALGFARQLKLDPVKVELHCSAEAKENAGTKDILVIKPKG